MIVSARDTNPVLVVRELQRIDHRIWNFMCPTSADDSSDEESGKVSAAAMHKH